MKLKMKMKNVMKMKNGNENAFGNEPGLQRGNELEMNPHIIKLSDCGYTPSETHLIDLDNKYSPDIATTTARLHCKVNGIQSTFLVKSDNIQDAIRESLPKICYQELVYMNNYTFKELDLPNPKYTTIEGETGEITHVQEFAGLLNSEIHIHNKYGHINLLHIKARKLYEVVIE